MYPILLSLHSWSRWFVLILGLVALYRAYVGASSRSAFTKADNGISAAFSGFIWLQVIIGLVLYVQGGWPARAATAAMDAAAKSEIRFFKMEHVALMIIAAIVAQVGRIALKRATDDTIKHRKAFRYFGIALLLVLLMIPWGIWNPHRPLFRF